MIAIDTSALIVMLFREAEADDYAALVQAHGRALVGFPTALEFQMVARGRSTSMIDPEVAAMLAEPPFEMVPFDARHYEAAAAAFVRYGKGQGSPARLNYGDCMAYAVAKVAGCPILFKGDDFTRTDLARVA